VRLYNEPLRLLTNVVKVICSVFDTQNTEHGVLHFVHF